MTKAGWVLIAVGAVLLIVGISGKFGWTTNVGLDLVGAALLIIGVLLSINPAILAAAVA